MDDEVKDRKKYLEQLKDALVEACSAHIDNEAKAMRHRRNAEVAEDFASRAESGARFHDATARAAQAYWQMLKIVSEIENGVWE